MACGGRRGRRGRRRRQLYPPRRPRPFQGLDHFQRQGVLQHLFHHGVYCSIVMPSWRVPCGPLVYFSILLGPMRITASGHPR
eukprot:6115545-Pyramimonas_sp.AAC.1